MSRIVILALLCAVASPALANEAVATASGVASLPYGDWVVALLQVVGPLAILVLTFAVRTVISKLLPIGGAFITDKFVESTVEKWVDYGINATAGAMKGKKLDVDTGSMVLANALNRAADRANASKLGENLMKWAGGPEEVANKIFRKLDLTDGASTEMVTEAVQDLRLRSMPAAAPAVPLKAKF